MKTNERLQSKCYCFQFAPALLLIPSVHLLRDQTQSQAFQEYERIQAQCIASGVSSTRIVLRSDCRAGVDGDMYFDRQG